MQNLEKFEEKIGYKFKDKNLLKRALTHKSLKHILNNERLEFLGDAVMDLIVGEYLFNKFKGTNEGDLSKLRAALVNEKSFSKLAKSINLGENIFLSSAEENNNGRKKDSITSDAFEAIMGAIYLESGLETCKEIAMKLLTKEFPQISLDELVKDYKTALQELTQSLFGQTPTYTLLSSKGPDHQKEFEMAVVIDGKEFTSGIGKSKKDAEQKAAKKAIEIINKPNKGKK
ncbi:MAG: ribonuclease III [Campylobacter sp.]|nr:ribonuclease III [Campylobacter sp.]